MDEIVRSIRSWNPWWVKTWISPEYTPREIGNEITKVIRLKHIKDVIGIRRCGKTTLLYQKIFELIKDGVDPLKIMFINFDDVVINTVDFSELLRSIYQINPEIEYLFLDEVQEKKGWERWVRTIYDTDKFKQIFVTGSNASILSRDIGKVLTGRHISFRLFPFSFKEFLIANKWTNFDKEYLLMENDKLLHYFKKYLTGSSFPEGIGKEAAENNRIFSNIFNDILTRDVASRYDVEIDKLNLLAKYLLTNFTKEYSFRSISNTIGINIETVERYLKFLNECFLVFNLDLFSFKLKTQFKQNKKVYVIDNGLRNHISFRFSDDYGKLLENLIFLELKRREKEIYFWKDKKVEIDFVVWESTKIRELIQVCWSLDDEKIKQREINGILTACKKFNLNNGTIITNDFSGKESIDGVEINYIPANLWLLGINKV